MDSGGREASQKVTVPVALTLISLHPGTWLGVCTAPTWPSLWGSETACPPVLLPSSKSIDLPRVPNSLKVRSFLLLQVVDKDTVTLLVGMQGSQPLQGILHSSESPWHPQAQCTQTCASRQQEQEGEGDRGQSGFRKTGEQRGGHQKHQML